MTVLSQTQMMLGQLLKEREAWIKEKRQRHREHIHWVEAMIRTERFQSLIHYCLCFDDGRGLVYQNTREALVCQTKERLEKEVTKLLIHEWSKEIHSGR